MNSKPEQQQVFQWNWGAWFGSQVGATVWMLICAIILFTNDVRTGAVALALFLLPNIVGTSLWAARQTIRAYPAIQILLAVCWVSSLASIYVIESSGLWLAVSGLKIDGVGGTVSAGSAKLMVALIFPVMMLWFHILQRGVRT